MSTKVLREFCASMDDLYPMLDFIRLFALALTKDQENLNNLRLIAEEVLTNIIKYAYKGNTGSIGIECERFQHTLKITFVDDGTPFDPIKEAKQFNLKAHERFNNPGGYGTFLILSLSDEVTYRREKGSNVLTVTKTVR